MPTKTYEWKITNEDAVLNKQIRSFARAYGWTPKILVDGVEVDNPVKAREILDAKLREFFVETAKAVETDLAADAARKSKREEVDLEGGAAVITGEIK